MQTLQIVLKTIDDVKRFVTLTNKYHFPIDLSNGKSMPSPLWAFSVWEPLSL